MLSKGLNFQTKSNRMFDLFFGAVGLAESLMLQNIYIYMEQNISFNILLILIELFF